MSWNSAASIHKAKDVSLNGYQLEEPGKEVFFFENFPLFGALVVSFHKGFWLPDWKDSLMKFSKVLRKACVTRPRVPKKVDRLDNEKEKLLRTAPINALLFKVRVFLLNFVVDKLAHWKKHGCIPVKKQRWNLSLENFGKIRVLK